MRTQFAKDENGKRFVLNFDASAWGTGTVRKLKGVNGVLFAACSFYYGADFHIEIYDESTLKILATYNGQLKDISKETQDGIDVIKFMKQYSEGLEILKSFNK